MQIDRCRTKPKQTKAKDSDNNNVTTTYAAENCELNRHREERKKRNLPRGIQSGPRVGKEGE